ncbi:hypothetical protein ACLB2K_002688 [Fragaria x ananassa]
MVTLVAGAGSGLVLARAMAAFGDGLVQRRGRREQIVFSMRVGVLRDHLGSWVDGFQIYLGTGEILDAEAWGLFFGLKLVFKHSIVNFETESDSVTLVQLMLKFDNEIHLLGSLLDGCVTMMANLQNVKLNHIFRECNMVADALAKDSINHDLGLITFADVPAHVVLDDLVGVTRARRTRLCSSI